MCRRPVFPYSVIAGGVRTPGELREAVARDPDIAAHYAGFDLQRARSVRLKRDMWAYVSYRLPEGIYWTARRAHLRRGEMLIGDKTHLARGRCGNRISEAPQFPVLASGPDPEDMEIPGDLIPPPFDPGFAPSRPSPPPPPPPRRKRIPIIGFLPIIFGGLGGNSHPRIGAGGPISGGPIIFLSIALVLWRFREHWAQNHAGQVVRRDSSVLSRSEQSS